MSDFCNIAPRTNTISFPNHSVIWGTHVFSLSLPSADLPRELTDLLNMKKIRKKSNDDIGMNTERLDLNNVSTDELAYILSILRKIKQLYLLSSDIDFSRFSFPPMLRTLIINNSNILNLKGFSNKENLDYLSLTGCNANDFSSIADFVNLETLILNNTAVKRFPPLQRLTKLQRVEANHTQIEDLTSLPKLSSLKVLMLKNASLKRLNGIKNLPALEHLDISNTSVSSISALEHLRNLKYINLINTAVSAAEIAEFRKQHPQAIVVSP